jgi:hypothetical protein
MLRYLCLQNDRICKTLKIFLPARSIPIFHTLPSVKGGMGGFVLFFLPDHLE